MVLLPEEDVMELLVLLVMVIVLDVAAMLWGVSSLDGPESPEWERRHNWLAFH